MDYRSSYVLTKHTMGQPKRIHTNQSLTKVTRRSKENTSSSFLWLHRIFRPLSCALKMRRPSLLAKCETSQPDCLLGAPATSQPSTLASCCCAMNVSAPRINHTDHQTPMQRHHRSSYVVVDFWLRFSKTNISSKQTKCAQGSSLKTHSLYSVRVND